MTDETKQEDTDQALLDLGAAATKADEEIGQEKLDPEADKSLLAEAEDAIHDAVEGAEEAVEEVLTKVEDAFGIKHGTHDAAMKGLQTDASGSYTPPPAFGAHDQ